MTNGSTSTTADLGALARPGTNRRALIARVEELVPEAEQATVFVASLGLRHDETGFRMGFSGHAFVNSGLTTPGFSWKLALKFLSFKFLRQITHHVIQGD
jgi:hypothetical protein